MGTKGPKKPLPHAFKPGVSANPSGRPKGIPNKFQLEVARKLAGEGIMPLDFLIALTRKDPVALRAMNVPLKDVTTGVRRGAAESAMPYCHRKMPIAVDGGEGKPLFVGPKQLQAMSDEELTVLAKVLRLSQQSMPVEPPKED